MKLVKVARNCAKKYKLNKNKIRRVTSKNEKKEVNHMLSLSDIRKMNENPKSALNIKMNEVNLTKEQYEEGRKFFFDVVEPINSETLLNYCKNNN